MTIQVAPDDCTGCGVCVDVCPAKSKEVVKHKAINMEPKLPHLAQEQANFDFFLGIPEFDRTAAKTDTVKGSQLLEPLFEFSGACAGCGETPYLKLMSQLFGDRAVIGNATGCSSIYGGNLPTTPWAQKRRGPRAGLEQLAVRGHRRIRTGPADGGRSKTGLCRVSAEATQRRSWAMRLVQGTDRGAADERGRDGRSSGGAWRCCASDWRRSIRPMPNDWPPIADVAGETQRVDRRRRRLGVRHRLRRTGSRADHRSRREHPGARYGRVFQHRRAGIEGHVPRARWRNSPPAAKPLARKIWA